MNKNTPLSTLSNDRSLFSNVNWEEIENNLSAKTYLFTRDIIFFAHSDSVMKQCFKLLNSENLKKSRD